MFRSNFLPEKRPESVSKQKQNDEATCARCSHNDVLASEVHSVMKIQHKSGICLLLATAKLQKLTQLDLENEGKH